jgi:hypothetical protein
MIDRKGHFPNETLFQSVMCGMKTWTLKNIMAVLKLISVLKFWKVSIFRINWMNKRIRTLNKGSLKCFI